MGRLELCPDVEGKEGLFSQPCLHAQSHHFLQRSAVRDQLYLKPKHRSEAKERDRPHHGLSALGRMKTIKRFLFIAFACWTTYACALLAGEEIKNLSPDGRFALRITQPKDDEYHPMVELIEKDSGKVMVTLHNGSDSDLFDASESVLVWSADSKSVAY